MFSQAGRQTLVKWCYRVNSTDPMVLPAMQLFVVLQLTATLLLVQTGHGHGQSTYDEERTSCVYTFVVPGSSSDEGCPGRGDSAELRRLSQSVDALKQIIEVLQVSLIIHLLYINHLIWLVSCTFQTSPDN